MKLEHLILTRFCVRIAGRLDDVGGPTFSRPQDPLGETNVDLRLRLLEITSAPSVRAQAAPVTWVILVDPALPDRHRAALERRLAGVPRAVVHVLAPRDDLCRLDWLTPYIEPSATHVVTSNLDDDDVLPVRFSSAIQDALRASEGPQISVLATQDVLQWDLVPEPMAPFGWVKPWHRGQYPSSCGFSAFSRRDADLCVLGLRHRFGEALVDETLEAPNANVAYHRARLAPFFEGWSKQALFHDLGPRMGPVVMSNHSNNDQATRLRERSGARRRVRGPRDLGEAPVDWAAFLRNALRFTRAHPQAVRSALARRLLD